MKNDALTIQSAVNRLAGMISRQFGCDFHFQECPELEHEEQEWPHLQSGLLAGKPVSFGDCVFLPVFQGDALVGAGRLFRRETISNKDLQYIHQMIRLVLESRLEGLDRLDWLARVESMSKDDMTNAAISNVVSIHSLQRNRFPLRPKGRLDLLNFPFLIDAQDEGEAYKLAQEIHSLSQRYAFLPIQDLSEEAFISTDSLVALGAITIYVSDITQLTRAQQARIAAYYATKARAEDSPQFIIISQHTLADLKLRQDILPQFLSSVVTSYLAMNKPFAYYKKSNLMDFFYDGL